MSETRENVFVFTSCLVSHYGRIHIQYFFGVMKNKLQWTTVFEISGTKYLELIKGRSKVQEKNMSCESALNFDRWKTFSENCKSMRVWLWLVYKFTENCQIYRLFSDFNQTKKRYPTSLDKIRILTRKQLVISS